MATESDVQDFLGYSEEEVQGQSVNFVLGPRSDSDLLHRCIESAAELMTSVNNFEIYDRMGNIRIVTTTCAPFYDQDGYLVGAAIDMKPLRPITLYEAFDETFGATALISSEWPHEIQMVSETFSAMFGYSQSQAIDQTIDMISGPSSDPSQWTHLFQCARNAQVQQQAVLTCTSTGVESCKTITCLPVLDNFNGVVTHMLLIFPPASPAIVTQRPTPEMHVWGTTATASPPTPAPPTFHPRPPPPCHDACPTPPPPPAAARTRRPHADAPPSWEHFQTDSDMDYLGHGTDPLGAAAAAQDTSYDACAAAANRNQSGGGGVRRAAGGCTHSPRPSRQLCGAAAAGGGGARLCVVDDAYVQRLYRKYSARRGGGAAAAAASSPAVGGVDGGAR